MKLGHLIIGAALLSALIPRTFAVVATGGNTTNIVDGYRIHTFTNSATASNFVVTVGGNVEVLVVAGGGGGGSGGGGAGGVLSTTTNITPPGSIPVIVGAGGDGVVVWNGGPAGNNGNNSFFGALTTIGGGGGNKNDWNPPKDGGSGGGGGAAGSRITTGGNGTPGQGNNGGGNGGNRASPFSSGGGGGAGTAGSNASGAAVSGKGGNGTNVSISGSSVTYAGGGGGACWSLGTDGLGGSGGGGAGGAGGTRGTVNTGSGGGGSRNGSSSGPGGSGIVIVRYLFGVDNANGATNVTATNAWLNGTLYVDTPNAAVFGFWGQSDGGQDASAWANTNVWAAPQSAGSFTVQATGLASDATWYYRYAVSNETGWTWALDTSVFITGDVWIDKTADASESGPTPGTFTVHRAAAMTNETLTVTYMVDGTAIPGTDYMALSGTVTIPTGEDSATIEVMPIFDYFEEEPKTVVVTLVPGPYVVGSTSNAVMEIADYTLTFRLWSGDGLNDLASNPTNWVGGEAPGAYDNIALETGKNMTWDLNIPVQSWAQIGYTSTVTIQTFYPGMGDFTNFTILGDCVISNGVWTHKGGQGSEVYRLSATIGGKLIVGPNASVNVVSKGYDSKYAPGYLSSYGGRSKANGPCYGSIVAPTHLGSGAVAGGANPGGGAIRLMVFGEMINNGLIGADGSNWLGASGGSIWITAGKLIGAGTIRANGGARGCGGGGRISLVVTGTDADFTLYTGPINAFGGGVGAGAGTVYLCTAAHGRNEGTLIIDNNGISGNATEINANVSDAVVGDVIIRNGGSLVVDTNQTLTVGGMWSNGASFTAQSGSQIIISGRASSTSTVYGNNTFCGLICTNTSGKNILFEAGKTNTIADLGRLILKGNAESNLILRSTSDGTSWKLNVTLGSVDQTVMNVDVKDSDALLGVGAQIIALNSLNRGNNPNWVFGTVSSGETNTWSGNSSTAWSLAANWSLGRPPIDDDSILIPSNCQQYPVLDNQARTVNGLMIQSGASLSLAEYNLTVNKNAAVAGELIAAATETIIFRANMAFTGGAFTAADSAIVCQGNVDFTDGAFTSKNSTLVLSGNTPQTVNLNDLSFYKINVLNTNTVTFGNGFSAHELRCEAADEARNLSFQPGTTVAVRDLVLLGSAVTTNIVLRSVTSGEKWQLDVSGYRCVQGVDVKDCDASPGVSITATSSRDSGDNLHWTFDAFSIWLGTSNTDFNNATNWLPIGVPSATTPVLVDVTNQMTITGAVTVLDLTVGGGIESASIKVSAPLNVVENIVVLNNGILALNRPCVVSNDIQVMAGGILTHDGPQSSEINKLDVTVCGNMRVDVNAQVNVNSKGYQCGSGPGYDGSYGGRGSIGGGGPCYGSILAPTHLGSGSGRGSNVHGGGAMRFAVFGEMKNDGLISTDGGGWWGAAGGSIWISAGTLRGNGTIKANGGTSNGGGGGGGRISLVVTDAGADFTTYTGSINAFGGGTGAGAGTIYKLTSGDDPRCGTVLLDNTGLTGYTDVPPLFAPTGETDKTVFILTNNATLRLTNDFTVGNIWLDAANAVLDLGSNTLTVNARKHVLSPGTVTNYGAIVWKGLPPGVLIIVK